MFEPTTTLTAVKTKTVTRTQMAVALACLGASIIAAAAMSIAGVPSNICLSNAKINVALTLGQGELVSSCKGQLIVPTPKFSQLLVRNYTDDTLFLIVDKKLVNFKVGEDYKPVGKLLGDVVGYQQNLYVAYSGKIDKKADIDLFYGYPAGEKGVFCSDTDESQQNYDGLSIKDFKFVNPYVKGVASFYDEYADETASVDDYCNDYAYGYGVINTFSAGLMEFYCSTADGGSLFSTTIPCPGGCVDGACVPVVASSTPPVESATSTVGCVNIIDGGQVVIVNDKSSSKVWWVYDSIRHEIPDNEIFKSWFHKEDGSANWSIVKKIPPTTLYQYTEGKPVCAKAEEPVTPTSTPSNIQQVGTMNLVSGGKLATNKLKAGENEVAKLSFSVTNEDVVVNQLIFNFDSAGEFKPEQVQSVVLKDSKGNVVGGPQILKQYGAKNQVVLQNPPKGLFTLSSATNESQNYSLYATVNDPALLYDTVSGFRVSIDPVKDVTAVGSKTLSTIKSTNQKLLAWQTMYGSEQPTLSVKTYAPYLNHKISMQGQEVNLAKFYLSNAGTDSIEVKSIKFTQLVTDNKYSVFSDVQKLWLVDDKGTVLSDELIPYDNTPTIGILAGQLKINKTSLTKEVILKGIVNEITYSNGPAFSGHSLGYKINNNADVVAVSTSVGAPSKVKLESDSESLKVYNYIYKTYPVIEKMSLEQNKLLNGTNDLFKFKISAPTGDISLYKFYFLMQTTGNAKIGDLYLFDITDLNNELALNSKAGIKTNTTPGNAVWATIGDEWKTNYPAGEKMIPKGQFRIFVLRGSVSGVSAGSAISTKLLSSTAPYGSVSLNNGSAMGTAKDVNNKPMMAGHNSFIWSDISSAPQWSHSVNSKDWTSGYGLPGLPFIGTSLQTIVY